MDVKSLEAAIKVVEKKIAAEEKKIAKAQEKMDGHKATIREFEKELKPLVKLKEEAEKFEAEFNEKVAQLTSKEDSE